jgi:hypothetical protein
MTRVYALAEAPGEESELMPPTSRGTVDPASVEAFVRIRLAAHTVPQVFEAWLLCRSSVRGVWSLAGDFDYEVRLICADSEDLAAEVRSIRRFGGQQTDTCLLLREVAPDRSIFRSGD